MYFELHSFSQWNFFANEVQAKTTTGHLQTTHRQMGNTVLLSLPHKFAQTVYQENPTWALFQALTPIQSPGFVPSDYQQALDSVHYPLDTALRAKPHLFLQTDVLQKKQPQCGHIQPFLCSSKLEEPFHVIANEATMSFMLYKNNSCITTFLLQYSFWKM